MYAANWAIFTIWNTIVVPFLKYIPYVSINIENFYGSWQFALKWRLKSPVSRLFTQPFIQAQIKENIKAASLAFVRGVHRWPVNSLHKGPVTCKMFSFDDVLMSDTARLLSNTKAYGIKMLYWQPVHNVSSGRYHLSPWVFPSIIWTSQWLIFSWVNFQSQCTTHNVFSMRTDQFLRIVYPRVSCS